MITIKDLHRYFNLSQKGLVPEFLCPMDESDGAMVPWLDDKDEPCFWCLSCNVKSYLGLDKKQFIMSLLHP